jgi:hypothetical protein
MAKSTLRFAYDGELLAGAGNGLLDSGARNLVSQSPHGDSQRRSHIFTLHQAQFAF